MKWKKYTINTTTEAEDIISSMLSDLGIEGVQIEDNVPLSEDDTKGMFIDVLPELPPDDGTSRVSFFLREAGDEGVVPVSKAQAGVSDTEDNSYTFSDRVWEVAEIEKLLKDIEAELSDMRAHVDIGEGTIVSSETEDADWMNNWKQYFKQFYVDDLLIIPSWEKIKPEDEGRPVIHIDPGTAFGTGMHETTQLCIRQIKKHVAPGCQMLDVGCGSGILSIAGILFGAGHAVMTDLDPCAVSASAENMAENGIGEECFQILEGNLIDDAAVQDAVGYGKYDLVTANILADVLVPLTPAVARCLKEGGVYISSGILQEKEQMVADAVRKAGLEILEITRQGEWVSVTARK